MKSAPPTPGTPPPQPSPVDAGAVRAQLDRLMASVHIRNSKRCQSLLRYVVDAALESTPERVKERTIGVEVFGRDPEYDTNQDSVVRSAAIEVRKRLAQYYLEPGHDSELRIDLPQGGYLPEFRAGTAAPVADPEVRIPALPAPRTRLWIALGISLMVCIAIAGWVWKGPAVTTSELDRFWAPLLKDPGTVLICVGQPTRLYGIIGPRQAELNAKLGTTAVTRQPAEVLERTPLMLSELNPVGSRHLFFGDALCTLRLAAMLQSRNRIYQVRGEASTPFQDLRGYPVLLVGLFNNRWTQRLTSGLRYYYVRVPEKQVDELRDRLNPGKAPWMIPGESQRTEDGFDDYAVVTREMNASTERGLITVAGVTQWGTQAAGDFITNPEYLREAFRHAPEDWHRRNIQVVLRTRAVGGAAGPPQVVAIHYW